MGIIETCKLNNQLPPFGTPVKINEKIAPGNECKGFLVYDRHIKNRRPNEEGIYKNYVPGAGGDLWWVEHTDKTIGAYMFTELTDV